MDEPFRIIGAGRPSAWVVSCDHASNHVPAAVGGGSLGIAAEDMARHIAWDVGAAGVAERLGALLEAPVILGGFSRLVIDPNRGEDDPTLVMRLYDGTIIPANRHVDAAEVERRLAAWHRPYHAALAGLMARPGARLLAIHSFTPCLRGRAPRPWHLGLLSAHDRRLADPLLARLAQEPDLVVGDNEPYAGHLPGDSVDRHALAQGRLNVLVELRNDLIRDAEGQEYWAGRLARAIRDVQPEE